MMEGLDAFVQYYNKRMAEDTIMQMEYNDHNINKTSLIMEQNRLKSMLKQCVVDKMTSDCCQSKILEIPEIPTKEQ